MSRHLVLPTDFNLIAAESLIVTDGNIGADDNFGIAES